MCVCVGFFFFGVWFVYVVCTCMCYSVCRSRYGVGPCVYYAYVCMCVGYVVIYVSVHEHVPLTASVCEVGL